MKEITMDEKIALNASLKFKINFLQKCRISNPVIFHLLKKHEKDYFFSKK